MNTSLVIYEDNTDLRESLSVLLNGTAGFTVVATFSNCENIKENIQKHKPNIVLMDIDMPIKNGIEGLKIIHKYYPETEVIMLTVFETNEYIFEALKAGAVGYILKKSSPLEIINAINEVKNGGSPMSPVIARKVLQFFPITIKKTDNEALTERETEVLQLLTKGYTYKMAAYELKISIETIRTYIKRIYAKLHVHSNTEAVAIALQNKIV